jgi:hypothetical protein
MKALSVGSAGNADKSYDTSTKALVSNHTKLIS